MKIYGGFEPGKGLVEEERTVPLPVCEGDSVLVRVSVCGLCHSDAHVVKGEMGAQKWGGYTLGHEVCGVVVSLGPRCRTAQLGQRVVVFPWLPAAKYKAKALGIGLDGGFSSHLLVPEERYVIPAPDEMEDAQLALLACSGLTAYSALLKAGIPDTLVIIGCGGVGFQGVRFAMAHKRVIVADIDEAKLEAARRMRPGVIAVHSDQLLETLKQHNGREDALSIIDFVGATSTINLAVSCWSRVRAPPSIRWVLVGMMGGELHLPAASWMIHKGVTLIPSMTGSLSEMRQVLEAARSAPDVPVELQPASASSLKHALKRMEEGSIMGRVVFVNNTQSRL